MWTGVLAWLPVLTSLVIAEGGRVVAWLSRVPGSRDVVRSTRLAAVGSLAIGLAAATAAAPRVPGGDEPHYLVITQSLLQDGDLRIDNNHAARDYAAYFGGTLRPDIIVPGRDGAIYSIHAPGVSALVLPGFALLGLRGAQATLLLVFALTGALVWRSAWAVTGESSAAWFAWAAVAGSTTMAVMSVMVFPDAPGACIVAAGVWLLASMRTVSTRAILAASALLAALPWLHTRFAVLAGAIGLVVLVMLMLDGSRPVAHRWRRLGAFVAIPALSAAAWLSMFYVMYGTFDPRVPYGPNPELRAWIWGAVTGLFVDQQFGLFTYAPVLAAAAIAPVVAPRGRWRLLAVVCLGILALYTIAVASYWMWWAGRPGLPARFLTAAVPLFAVPLAIVWSRATAVGRSALLTLLTVSLGITAALLAVDSAAMAWNDRHGQAAWLEWLNPVVNLPRAWPSFFWNGEAAFLRHSALLLTTVAAAGWLTVVVGRRFVTQAVRLRLGAGLSLLFTTMVAVQAGWLMTGSEPLDPARAQLQVHAAAGDGTPVWQVWPGLHRWDSVVEPLRITSDQPRLSDSPSQTVLSLTHVPAGRYRLDVSSRGEGGELRVSIDRSSGPLFQFAVAPTGTHQFPVTLPAGAAVLVAEAPDAGVAAQWSVTLTPVSAAGTAGAFARVWARYGETEVFFLDGNVFAEAQGFWVRGGRTAAMVLGQSGPLPRTHTLNLRNGGAANTVTIQSGAWREVLSLAPWEERAVPLPQADARGAWSLMITSESGFRPSDEPGQDNRFLGVWVGRAQ
jgi:hypothetical protein